MSAAPTPYAPSSNFVTNVAANMTFENNASAFDIEFGNLQTTTDNLISRLSEVQNPDGTPIVSSLVTDAINDSAQALSNAQVAVNIANDAQSTANYAATTANAALAATQPSVHYPAPVFSGGIYTFYPSIPLFRFVYIDGTMQGTSAVNFGVDADVPVGFSFRLANRTGGLSVTVCNWDSRIVRWNGGFGLTMSGTSTNIYTLFDFTKIAANKWLGTVLVS